MRSNNINEAITHLAMPERQIPVLIDSTPDKAEGFVPLIAVGDKPVTSVRRLLPQFVQGLARSQRRLEIEKEHGTIDSSEWNRLREMLGLIDRLNVGDLSSVTTSNAEEALKDLPAWLDRMSPEGWFVVKDESGSGARTLRSASGDVQLRTSVEIALADETAEHREAARRVHPVSESDRKTAIWRAKISGICRTAPYALAEAFTRGLSKTRFVVWWSHVGKKLVPGLYCPDIVTALYALAMWSSGTAGGWAICQRCNKDYPRSRAKQRYCSHECQVAAAMKRYRKNMQKKAKSKSKTTKTKKTKKRKRRK
jgi:hypothetical protein